MRSFWEFVGEALGVVAVCLSAMAGCSASAHADDRVDERALTFVVIGTSLSIPTAGWSYGLAERLSKCVGQPVTIEVLAQAGATSRDAIIQLKSRRTKRPDIVIAEFAANDSDVIDGIRLEESRRNNWLIVKQIRLASPSSNIVFLRMNPIYGPKSWFRPNARLYEDIYGDIAINSQDVIVVDPAGEWQSYLRGKNRWREIPDGLHPTADAATRVLVPALVSRLANIFRNAGRDCFK